MYKVVFLQNMKIAYVIIISYLNNSCQQYLEYNVYKNFNFNPLLYYFRFNKH